MTDKPNICIQTGIPCGMPCHHLCPCIAEDFGGKSFSDGDSFPCDNFGDDSAFNCDHDYIKEGTKSTCKKCGHWVQPWMEAKRPNVIWGIVPKSSLPIPPPITRIGGK